MHANLRRYSMPSAGIYDRVTGLLFRDRYDEIARQVGAEAPAGATVLDAGCGPGEILVRVARFAPSLRLTGLDVDATMIDRAERKAARWLRGGTGPASVTAPTFVVSDVAAMPFADESFDLVVSSFSVHHWPDPHAGLAEVVRVLKVGGRAIVWDITDPMELAMGASGSAERSHAGADGHGGASEHGASRLPSTSRRAIPGTGWLTALRMLLQFRRITPQRHDFVKGRDGVHRVSPTA